MKRADPFAGSIGRRTRMFFQRIWYFGSRRYCPICRLHARKFTPYGLSRRLDVRCPYCGSAERHRLVWRFLADRTDLLNRPGLKLLHLAPEPSLENRLRRIDSLIYITADLISEQVMLNLDITAAPFGDGSFDAIIACHVLQHIPEDIQAMREIHRILRPGGWAIFTMPVDHSKDASQCAAASPCGPTHGFELDQAARVYGNDFPNRAGDAGFAVEIMRADGFLDGNELTEMGLLKEESLYFCRR